MDRDIKISKGKKHIELCDICYKINKGFKLNEIIDEDELQYYKLVRDYNNYCLIRDKDNKVELCFKSSANARDLSTSLNNNLVRYDEYGWYNHKENLVKGCMVHRGYKRFWLGMRQHLLNYIEVSKNIYITGHSMGGAIAILAAYDLSLNGLNVKEVVTFGAPKIGNDKFVENYNILLTNKTIQFQIVFDPITIFPVRKYTHVDKKFKMGGLGHSFRKYYNYFQKN